MSQITQDDVKDLYNDASAGRRAILAQKIGYNLKNGELSDTETELALAICQTLAEDVEVTVRQALSEAVKTCPYLPRELAVSMANDVLDVSLPIIEFSEVLEDEDLVDLIHTDDLLRQIAITKRETISPDVCQTLAEECREYVVDSLLKNDGAQIKLNTYYTVLDRFEHSQTIHETLAKRDRLPEVVIANMIDLVSDQLKAYMVARHPLSNILAEKLILESKEDAKRRLLNSPTAQRDTEKIVKALDQKNKLSNEIIMRSIEVGDLSFFEHAMALRVGIPVKSARILIKDQGKKGFAALYQKANLPQSEYESIQFIVEAEYNSANLSPRASTNSLNPAAQERIANWVTESSQTDKKWRLFKN